MCRTQRMYRELQFFTSRLKSKMDPRRFPKGHNTLLFFSNKMTIDPNTKFNKSVKFQDQDCHLSNSILKLPKIKKDFQLTPIPPRKVDVREVQNWTDKQEKTLSKTLLHEMRHPEKLNSLEECKKIVYDNLDNIKKKEAANFALLEEKRFQERVKQQLGQKLREEQERDKKAILKKSVSDMWDAKIQANKQKKKKIAEQERQQMAATMESDRLHQIEEIEMRRQKKEKDRNFFWRQDETEPNMEDQKKTVVDNLEDILRKEAAYDSLLQTKLCNTMAKEEVAKMLHEAHQQEKETPKQKTLADKVFISYHNKQEQKREMDRAEREGVLPGYPAEEIGARKQKKDPQQKLKSQDKTKKHMDNTVIMQWEIHHRVTEHGRDVQYESGFLDYESECDIPDKDRSREIRKKIVYNQLSLIKKEEAKKRAFMEDKLLEEQKQWESAEQKLEKLEKEKKAAALKSLTNSWDSQIQLKRQEKKELCDIERKDMQTLMELDRVCGGEKSKPSPQTLPGRSTSKNCEKRSVCSADKHDDAKPRPSVSRQKVRNTKPVTLPSLTTKTVHFAEDCQQLRKRVKFPTIFNL